MSVEQDPISQPPDRGTAEELARLIAASPKPLLMTLRDIASRNEGRDDPVADAAWEWWQEAARSD